MNRDSTTPLHTGRTMPVLGLGTWELTRDTADVVRHALELGYRMIDTAVDYGSQQGIGPAIELSDLPREDIYLVHKVEEDDDALDATRRYLAATAVDHADLMLIHRPPERGVGEELWAGLVRAREEGLVRDIGVSNYTIDQMERLIDRVGEQPVVNQIEWTPFGWSPDMLDWCRENEIVIQGYSPLTRAERLDDDALRDLAAEHDATPAQVLLRWGLQKGTVPLPKANDRGHLEENLGAFDLALDDEDMQRLDALNEQWSALGSTPQYL